MSNVAHQSFFFASARSPSLIELWPNTFDSESHTPPNTNAQNKFSNGINGSWIPSNIDDICDKIRAIIYSVCNTFRSMQIQLL